MPRGLIRYEHTGSFHFLTFSCYHRSPYLCLRPGELRTVTTAIPKTEPEGQKPSLRALGWDVR